MSALAAYGRSLPAVHALSELEAFREVSRICSAASDAGRAVNDIAATVLRTRGVLGLEIGGATPRHWGKTAPGEHGTAISKMAGLGDLKLHFDLRKRALESPLRFTRFLAHQIGNLAARFELIARNDKLERHIEVIGSIIARRKAIHRARAILCRRNSIGERAALSFLRHYGRQRKISLWAISDAIILSDREALTMVKPVAPPPGFAYARSGR